MIVGVLKESKPEENRVALTPAGAEVLRNRGHEVLVQTGAGIGSGFADADYQAHGATMLGTPEALFRQAELLLHVKEPQPEEYAMLREGQILFTYLHLAASEPLTRAVIKSKAVAIAYETVQGHDGSLPLLTPMSEVAGRMAVQQGARYLEMTQGGRGVLLGGVPGVDPGVVMVLGGGTVGTHAAKVAAGLGARVIILDQDLERLRTLSEILPANCTPMKSTPSKIRSLLPEADVVVGSVLIPGALAPRIITRSMLGLMKKGAVMVDVAIDQGGCFETSKPTTHSSPVYEVEGVVHYCVPNMPGAVPKTSTEALTNATLPYAVRLADMGWKEAMRDDPGLAAGANVVLGKVTCPGVAEAFGLKRTAVSKLL